MLGAGFVSGGRSATYSATGGKQALSMLAYGGAEIVGQSVGGSGAQAAIHNADRHTGGGHRREQVGVVHGSELLEGVGFGGVGCYPLDGMLNMLSIPGVWEVLSILSVLSKGQRVHSEPAGWAPWSIGSG